MPHDDAPTAPVGSPVLADRSLRHALPAGTHVLTAAGARPVEALAPGDRVITRDLGMAVVRAVHSHALAPGAPMVRLPAGALGRGRPERDLDLPPDQPVALRGWRARTLFGAREARVAAARLVDGVVVRRVRGAGGPAVALVLDQPAALFAEGLEVISASAEAAPPGGAAAP